MKLSPPQSFGGALEAVECGPEHPFWSLGPQLREAETSMRPTQRVTEPFVDSSQQLFTKPFPRRWRGCWRRSERISPPAPGAGPLPSARCAPAQSLRVQSESRQLLGSC